MSQNKYGGRQSRASMVSLLFQTTMRLLFALCSAILKVISWSKIALLEQEGRPKTDTFSLLKKSSSNTHRLLPSPSPSLTHMATWPYKGGCEMQFFGWI